ncbi:hypothetical protein [Flavobacterium foetidum]|uniref:hypothetical protein n=1 Tax=Flavobacterium foetidum TaxID=2026681 RepID=UPI0010757B8C|nr:hypothetical protein [Flavobacterium foetidum]KAF2516532.1 hypothetical protein E0W73_05425 [Flavobacterium foetidum]
MKSTFIHRISQIILSAFFLFSCSSDLDFDQVEDFKLEPVFVANLAYFDVPANRLVNNGGNQIAYDARDFDVFRNKFLTDHLKKAAFDVEIENTIERAFAVNILLLSADDSVLETIPYVVPAYNGSANVVKYPTQIFENQRLDLLKQTVKLGFVVIITAGPPLNQNSIGDLKLKSSGTVYLEIE